MALTRDQKRRLAGVVISQVAELFENWDERIMDGNLSRVEDKSRERPRSRLPSG